MTDDYISIPPHPLGVKPLGNHYIRATPSTCPVWILPEELVVVLLEYLDSSSLLSLGATCKAFFAFSRLEDFWKDFCTRSSCPSRWRGTWYATHRRIPQVHLALPSCNTVCSDILYRPHLCAHTPLSPYTSSIPECNAIARLSSLDASDFHRTWLNRPFIISTPSWPASRDLELSILRATNADTIFRAEAVDWPMHTYAEYMNDNVDETPLYLFDAAFAEKMKLTIGPSGDLWAPKCFGEDLFERLGEERPEHRWLIVGPARSGSSFHQDPNATSAWNAVIQGKKYWLLFPPGRPPPGVYPSRTHAYVTAPVSIPEYLISFHAEARATSGCIEAVVEAGKTLHVPAGWWHLVLNLEVTVAVTGNFVPQGGIGRVLNFLKRRVEQVSGFRVPNDQVPELVRRRLGLGADQNGVVRKRRWSEVVSSEASEGDSQSKEANIEAKLMIGEKESTTSSKLSTFRFGFGGDDSDEESVP